jgi:hypothetical protein
MLPRCALAAAARVPYGGLEIGDLKQQRRPPISGFVSSFVPLITPAEAGEGV